MKRKKWTAKTEVTDALLKFREKRKWQLAFRRYVLERMPNQQYAPYFGLPIEDLRKWIEIQFSEELNWQNFGVEWQFDHIVPVAYFDYSIEEDLRLCWNFINIRVEKLNIDKTRGHGVDILAVKSYYESLFQRTGLGICEAMITKIKVLEVSGIMSEPELEQFIIGNKATLDILPGLTTEEFNSLNTGNSVEDILLEREIMKKFGS